MKPSRLPALAPNLVDRVVSYFDPAAGARRMHARTTMALAESYTSTNSTSATRYWRPAARSAAADQAGVLPTLRGQSRDLARNHPLGSGAINTNVDRAVGTGLALSAQPNARVLGWTDEQTNEFKAHVQAEYSMWADSKLCDLTERLNFYELQGLVLRAALESGDCFGNLPDAEAANPLMPYRLRIQVLEADRVGNPRGQSDTDQIAGGIKMDAVGKPTEAFVYKRHPGSAFMKGADRYAGDWMAFKGSTGRQRLLHLYRCLRPEQPRGVPYLAPVINEIKQLGRYTEAEITAAVVSSMFTAFVKTKNGDSSPIWEGMGPPPGAAGAQGGTAPSGSAGSDELAMGHGAVVDLAEDEEVTFANPSRPNTGFDAFIGVVSKLVGVGLNLPEEVLMKRFNSSYSASRAALLDAWQWLRGVRNWLAINFCQPVYETWFAEAVAIGRIEAPGFFEDPLLRWAYTRAAWNGDSMGSLNPKDEVAAYRDAIDGNLMTHEQAEWALFGTDWNATLPSKAAERAAMKKAGLVSAPRAGAAAQPPGAEKPADDQPKPDGEDDEQ